MLQQGRTDELMDLKDVFQYLKLSYNTVQKWAKNGAIPAFKLGDTWRVRRCDLDDWINKKMDGGASNNNGRST